MIRRGAGGGEEGEVGVGGWEAVVLAQKAGEAGGDGWDADEGREQQ